jgi:peptide/nickel transport system ATP-binding protein
MAAVLEVSGLNTVFHTRGGLVHAVRDVSFSVNAGETLAIVGESGCGKTITALSLMRLIPMPPGEIVSGSVRIEGTDLLQLDEATMREMRGGKIAMVVIHDKVSRRAARDRAVEMLHHVRIPEAERRAREYPHQMSGGMRQRAMIAMALACRPKILIADEPTTALDVTIQAQILDLIGDLRREFGTAVVLITHDLGVVAETANRVVVMYAGRKVEEAPVRELFANPMHPYMTGLLASIPKVGSARGLVGLEERLTEIPGIVPPLSNLPAGCAFSPRCTLAEERCHAAVPGFELKRPDHSAACWRT